MKKLVAVALLCGLVSSSFAIGIGEFKINPEAGISYGVATPSNTSALGGYARVWLFGDGLTIAPNVKYNYMFGKGDNKGWSNVQAGGLIGYRIFRFTPYVGASYSGFSNAGYADTTALNYGIYFDIPILPFSVGLDASWQQPKVLGTDVRQSQHQIALTLGLIF